MYVICTVQANQPKGFQTITLRGKKCFLLQLKNKINEITFRAPVNNKIFLRNNLKQVAIVLACHFNSKPRVSTILSFTSKQ